ncbi:MAG: AAA family ATPase [Myxococcota bacterium]
MSDQLNIPIERLPAQLTYDEAVEAAYREDLDWIEEKLSSRLSVLIECDKQLANYVYKALRKRFKSSGGPRLRLLSGHPRAPDPDNPMQASATLTQRILDELRESIYGARDDGILAITHLDILTTTTRSSLNVETREAAAIMYENPDLVFLGFVDPGFEIPSVIEKVFTVKCSLVGIARDKLPQLILQREARKFGVEEFNPYQLYKYVSGLNAVRCRQIMAQLESRVDFDPAVPGSVDAIYADIRRLTLLGDLEVPRVDLDSDIGGYAKVKDKIRKEILDLLLMKEASNSAEEIKAIEEIVPKGMIFWGPPGTGKTFFAKAIATALNATVTIVSGPELKSKWVGESEENLRRVFAQARKSAPAIIIFDELDSFASARGTYTGSGVEHSMVNQLLTEMDGFRKEELVFVVGTTNFEQSLDPALMRPGRFELSINIPYPDKEDRKEIVSIYQKKFGLHIDEEVFEHILTRTEGHADASRGIRYSGDHLYALMRGLKREQLRRGVAELEVTQEDVDKVIGRRKSRTVKLDEHEKSIVAIHEAGHAILAYVLPHSPSVERVTIDSELEGALGYVMHEVANNKHMHSRAELLDNICVALGGREAELMTLGEITTGCSNDLHQATAIASYMVEELGMSENLGVRTYRNDPRMEDNELARILKRRDVAESTAAKVDMEIKGILDTQLARCQDMLKTYSDEHAKMVEILLEKKTIGLAEIKELFGGREFKVRPSKKQEDRDASKEEGVERG